MRNFKGEIITFDKKTISNKNELEEQNKKEKDENEEDETADDSKGVLYSDARMFWNGINNNKNSDTDMPSNEYDFKLKSKSSDNIGGAAKSKIKDTEELKNLKKVVEKWKYFTNNIKKLNGVYLLQTIGSVLKAIHLLENDNKKLSKSEQIKLYKIIEDNENIINFLTKNVEKKKFDIENLIPDEHPEKFTTLAEIQKHLDNFKILLENRNLKSEDRRKIEQLRNLYLKQKNILIENEEKKVKAFLEEKVKIDINKYLAKEQERRKYAQEKEQKEFEKKIHEKEEENRKREKTIIVNPIDLSSKKTKIFHNQKPMVSDKKNKWEDNLFKPNKSSLCPFNKHGWIYPKNVKESDLENWEKMNDKWCRFEEIEDMKNFDVFIEGSTIDDIQQGNIGDCYFLSSVGALCEKNDIFTQLFYTQKKSSQNIYGIYLFLNGRWKLVLIDDFFPYLAKDMRFKQLFFSLSFQNEIWVSLIEKAWAKVNGCYANIGCGGYCYEAFDVLTEAYTEHISIDKKKGDELWKKMEDSLKNKYAMTAGTSGNSFLLFDKVGLLEGHAYTIINTKIIKEENVKLVKMKNPWGNKEFTGEWSNYSKKWTPQLKKKYSKDFPGDNNDGIFFMSFNDFLKYFFILDICKLETGYKSTQCKINKKESKKCQVIKFVLDKKYPRTYIQLYQKNPRIIRRKDKTYHPDPVMAYIILAKEEKNNTLKYINSITSLPSSSNNKYRMHISLEENLERGTYYIFCDVNYRFLDPDYRSYGYTITFYSQNPINFEKITEKIDPRAYMEKVMIYYCTKIEKKYKCRRGVDVYTSEHSNKDLPFKYLCFYNTTNKNKKIKVDVKQKDGKSFCIYNDNIASEFDTSVIKEIKPGEAKTILIMEYTILSNFQVNYDILPDNDKRTYENDHPVFKEEKEEVDEKGYLFSYYLEDKGYIIGLENISNQNMDLELKLEGLCLIDFGAYGKNSLRFIIGPKSKKIFNVIKDEDKKEEEAMFYFNIFKK